MNLDYILLVESGFLVMAAIGAGALARVEPTRRWSLLAFFALTQIARAWAALIAIDLGENVWAVSAEYAAMGTGIAILVEFVGAFVGGSGHFLRTSPAARVTVHASLALAAGFAGWRFGPTGLAVFLTAVGTAVSLGAGWILLVSARTWSSRGSAWRLRLLGGLLPLYVFSTTLLRVAPASAALFSSVTASYALAAAFAIGLSLMIYLHHAILQKQRLPSDTGRAWRRRRYLCHAAVWVVVIAGWLMAEHTAKHQDAAMRREILVHTRLAASAIDPELVANLHWDSSDLTNPSYRRLKAAMIGLRQANSEIRFAMLTGLRDGQAFFLVDSEPPTSPDYSPPGQTYTEAELEYLAALARHEAFALGPVEDRWGTWMSGSAPVMRLPDGRSITLDLDVAAATWTSEIRQARLPTVLITLLICVLLIGFFQAQERLRESARQTSLSEERMRAARDAAEAATRAKSEFLAVMSHELRTPLAGVIGMLDLLRRAPPEATRVKYTAVARDSAETLLRLLDDILDSAKIEAGRLTLESIPFRPRDAFPHLCEAARLRAENKGLAFTSTIAAAVPEVLVGDPTRLRQVLGNLQNNALKFTEHGEVVVEIDCRPIDQATGLLLISVRDTGCGISEEHRARLFGKFEQADLSTTRRYGGTGLGLSIVKALADAMHGSVTVQSTPGQGSTFTFAVPLAIGRSAAVPAPADDAASPCPRSTIRLRILCAEDDPVNRLVAEALLTHLGHVAEFAENGALAIERLRRERFDLVLMDGRMPVMDGFRATRAIRNGDAGVLDPHIYICAATANVSDADRKRCVAAGMNDYVKKPLAERALFEALARATAWLAEHELAPVLAAESPTDLRPAGLSEAELLATFDDELASRARMPEANFATAPAAQLAALFWEQAPARMAALRAAFDAGDAAEVSELAHPLKSAAFYGRAAGLSRHFAALETEADRGTLDECAPLLAQAEAEFARLRPTSIAGNFST